MAKVISRGLAKPDDPIFSEGVQFFSKRSKPKEEEPLTLDYLNKGLAEAKEWVEANKEED